jgi:multidrug efflux pump subunit AcrB
MTIVSLTAIQAKPDANWEDLQKQLKKAADLVRKHGGENVTALWTVAGGTATGTVSMLASSADWTSYGKTQDALWADPEMQALVADPNSSVAGWDTYVSQTIPDL